jgi:thiamine biosynthesis protein ThiS
MGRRRKMALKEIEIILNGMKETIREGLSIAQLMEISNENDKNLIVELNGRFVYVRVYSTTLLNEGDKVEFIYAACGG